MWHLCRPPLESQIFKTVNLPVRPDISSLASAPGFQPEPEPERVQARTGGMLALMTDAYGGYGGIAQYNRDFLAAAADAGCPGPITVITRMANDELGPMPSQVEQKPPTMNKFGYAARALALALRQRPKVIYNAHLYHGPLSMRLARLTGAKLVSQLHGTEIWDDVPRGCMAALEASDLILTVSRDTCARTLAKARIAPEKVIVINNTVGAPFTPGDRDAARRRFALDRETVLLTVARLDGREGYKGHDRIIPLLPRLLASGVDAVYLIAGEGPDQDRLEELAQHHGVADRVRFLGKIPVESLPDLYRAADLFTLPSTGEGFGISFVEAMACGTPAIGLAVGGAPDALVDGALGTCVAPERFADALIDLLVRRPDHLADHLADRPAELARRTRQHFDYPIFANQIRTQLQKVW